MILESRLTELEATTQTKVTEVNNALATIAKENQAQEVFSSIPLKVKSCVTAELQERQLQEKNGLKVRIGGLSAEWDLQAIEGDYEGKWAFLKEALHPIHVGPEILEGISSKPHHDTGEHIGSGQAILHLHKHEDRIRLLQQSHLLKGKSVWIAEELTPHQLKQKAKELKKMHNARREGKWAVF